MPAIAMNHFTILTDDLDATVDFYGDLLGLHPGPRPPFTFPGAWMYAESGGEAILHVIAGRALPEPRAGVIDHMAFTGRDLPDVLRRLKARNLPYDLRHVPGSGVWQLFFHDPSGAKVELDFDATETDQI
ncbi:MAG: VOC family protein [Betaproteobacteria bacterium]|jgi:catechol 2,3-dioxygenase-like lactoylglutathione lyase family enzyme